MNGWSGPGDVSASTRIVGAGLGEEKFGVRITSSRRPVLGWRRKARYSSPLAAKRSVMSNVPTNEPATPGRIRFNDHVMPPSVETKIGAFEPPPGSTVNAVPAISNGFAGLTARFGSESWNV